MVRLAIVGCGAVAELCHLPAARSCPDVQVVALVDKNVKRARTLAARFGVGRSTADFRELFGQCDGVVNALPHYLHAPVTIEFLERGLPVLVEKPLALTSEEARSVVKAAEDNGVPLQVGLMYHFCSGARLVKKVLGEGWLGALQGFSLESGFVYDWPVASGFFFNKEQAGGGVLVDTGSHMLELLLWWLGDAVDVEYRDDSLGGVEADCSLSLTLQGPAGPVQGAVTLSRLRKLGDIARIVGERFVMEYDLSTPDKVHIRPRAWEGEGPTFVSDFHLPSPQSWNDVYAEQLRAFARAIAAGGKSVIPDESVSRSVALIERCYRERQPLDLPWMRLAGPV